MRDSTHGTTTGESLLRVMSAGRRKAILSHTHPNQANGTDIAVNGSGLGKGFYTWVFLSTRQTLPAYAVSGTWYAATGESSATSGP